MRFAYLCLSVVLFCSTLSAKSDSPSAEKTLSKLISNYANSKTIWDQDLVDPSMLGFQDFQDQFQQSQKRAAEIKVTIDSKSTQVVGHDVTVIRMRWKKQSLHTADQKWHESAGESLFFFKKIQSHWKLVGHSGDHLFSDEGKGLL